MKWQDVFYFAKGERQALGLLLGLIALTWAAVIYTDGRREPDAPVAVATRDTIVGPARDTTRTTPRRDTPPPPTPLPQARAEAKKADSPRRSATYDKKRASRPRYPRVEKYPAGTVVELNSADTTILKRVPGIGSAFARRIVNFRAALGGFHSVEQLSEVYGIDAERYRALRPWFAVDTAAIRPRGSPWTPPPSARWRSTGSPPASSPAIPTSATRRHASSSGSPGDAAGCAAGRNSPCWRNSPPPTAAGSAPTSPSRAIKGNRGPPCFSGNYRVPCERF